MNPYIKFIADKEELSRAFKPNDVPVKVGGYLIRSTEVTPNLPPASSFLKPKEKKPRIKKRRLNSWEDC